MDWFDTILYPIMVAVAWIMVRVHELLVLLGMSEGSGLAWILSIVGLVIVIRIVLIPLFFKQIKAARGMQLVQPEMQKLQKKYKNKTDPASRQKMQQEMMALYREHGTNPFASCLPILLQMPIFFALFRVLVSLGDIATGAREGIGPLTQELAIQAEGSTLFGARISETFLRSEDPTVKVVTVILIIIMSATTFFTQRQLTMKNMPAAALDNPMARQQRMMMYVLPLIFAFSGVNFPIGVLIYWSTTNIWSMGQQFYTIRQQPAPGSEAYKARQERIAKKRERKGLPPVEEEEQKAATEVEVAKGQRVQPKRKDRAKKAGPAGATAASVPAPSPDDAEPEDDEDADGGAPIGKDGLTPAERAQKRYDERAAQRRAAAAKRKAQGKNQGRKK
ncbi:membrane protein insertase YidC [Georgenia subflava]|uniref:Membrane protein insertase YidC n=1 Tax=Georgenia subflava TaxID=1622177 RepID=A0A6N7EHR9_9MICO|nr:membrane protein insertase YidC [Georgenia subflava]MPV37932.1 membrane protein insertase YidC [Georgenia subflava]